MVNISGSLQEAIQDEPSRFIKDLDFNAINKAKNPQKEFLKQIEKRFDRPTGIYLWKFLLNNYTTINKIYKMDIVQNKLEDLPENLNKDLVKEFYENYEQRKIKEQEKRESKVKKPIKVSSHIRNGKKIEGYSKTKGHRYSDIQENFLKSKVEVSVKTLADQFNNAFKTKLTFVAVRDKRLRLLGMKE